jgi:hypothetical protein
MIGQTHAISNTKTNIKMKTKLIITAALILTATLGQATTPKRTLTFYDALGRALTMPVKVEEATDTLPFDQAVEFSRARRSLFERKFDLSEMSKPETEVNDIPCELRPIIR